MSNKMLLTATKDMRYSTRRLLAGDSFEASRRDGKLLIALGRASEGRSEGAVGQIPERLAERVKHQEMLLGSSLLNAYYQIGDENVSLGKIVATAHKESGMTVDEWNSLGTNDREVRLQSTLDAMILAAAPASTDDDEGNDTGTSEGAGSGDSDGGGDGNDDEKPIVDSTGKVVDPPEAAKVTPAPVPPVDETPAALAAEEDIQTVRQAYHDLVGRRAYAGWDIPTIKEKMADFEKSKA